MREETKDTIYMLLDLLDSLSKTSQSHPQFIHIDQLVFNDVKNEIFNLLNQPKDSVNKLDKKTELIGILPYVLIDKNKFPANEDIVRLANKSLNLEISRWEKRSRDELIGIIIAKIALKDENELEKFFAAWKEFIRANKPKDYKEEKKDFVSIWLDFFNHYKRL
jgi:hypothetical protein